MHIWELEGQHPGLVPSHMVLEPGSCWLLPQLWTGVDAFHLSDRIPGRTLGHTLLPEYTYHDSPKPFFLATSTTQKTGQLLRVAHIFLFAQIGRSAMIQSLCAMVAPTHL